MKSSNKSETYNKAFYRCNTCKMNLCPLCKTNKNQKDHIIINYEQRNYICDIHNAQFTSYCENCKKNLCMECENDHNQHEVISFGKIMIKKDDLNNNLNKLKNTIDKFKDNITEIINRLNNVAQYFEKYYKICKDIINNYDSTNVNYEILFNINKILINKNLIDNLNDINKENNIIDKFNNINEIYNKIFNIKGDNLTNEENTIKEEKKLSNSLTIQNVKNLNEIKLFGEDFVKENNKNCFFVYNGKEYKLTEKFSDFNIKDIKNNNNTFKIVLEMINCIESTKGMFYSCDSLASLPDIGNWNTSKVRSMEKMFYGSNMSSLPDISKMNVDNVKYMSKMFEGCYNLSSLPDISKWNTSNVRCIESMFSRCSSLSSLPDISKWNINKVTNMSHIFDECSSLSSLPDISKWNINNFTNLTYMFHGCSSLSFLPDISKWSINNADIFDACENLILSEIILFTIEVNNFGYFDLDFRPS